MTLHWPLLLLTLLVVPLALGCWLLLRRRRTRYAVRYTNLEVLAAVAQTERPWRRWLPPVLFLASLALVGISLARPEVTVAVPSEQATIVLTIDTSGSMTADDVKPTRLAAAQEAARLFLKKIPKKVRVGLVAFSSDAYAASPATTDREPIESALGLLYPGAGTAIGDAIARSIEVGRNLPPSNPYETAPGVQPQIPPTPSDTPVAILLLSDGHQTRGFLQPLEAAQRAKALKIPIYTVSLGTPEGTITFERGGFSQSIPVPPDPETLKQIADTTGGEFFDAPDQDKLKAVYDQLGSRLGRKQEHEEITYAFAAAAAALLVAAGLLSGLWSPRLL